MTGFDRIDAWKNPAQDVELRTSLKWRGNKLGDGRGDRSEEDLTGETRLRTELRKLKGTRDR